MVLQLELSSKREAVLLKNNLFKASFERIFIKHVILKLLVSHLQVEAKELGHEKIEQKRPCANRG